MPITKILVVDDSPADVANIRTILSDAGYAVFTASSGRDAIARAKAQKPDLIFMDIVMPDTDGYAACRELTRDPETKAIPVVFVSSKSQKADQLWARMQGGRAYITKPYSADAIIDQIKTFS